jgi:hypothetical protein
VSDDTLTRRRYAAARAREGIPVSLILNKLVKHVKGGVDLTVTQLRAAEILLKKAMPDLQAVEHSGDIGNRNATELSREELERIAAGSGNGAAPAFKGNGDASGLH